MCGIMYWILLLSCKQKFEDHLKEKNMQYNKSKEEITKEFEAKLQAAKDRVANRSEKAKTHATRIIRRNPGSISYKHKEEFEAIRSDDKGSRAKTTKEGFLYSILTFLEKQGLIEYVEEDEMVKTSKKLDNLMDWNLLNQNNYQRVRKVLEHE